MTKFKNDRERRIARILENVDRDCISDLQITRSGVSFYFKNGANLQKILIQIKDDSWKKLYKRVRPLFNRDSLSIEFYIRGHGVIHTIPIEEYLFEELL